MAMSLPLYNPFSTVITTILVKHRSFHCVSYNSTLGFSLYTEEYPNFLPYPRWRVARWETGLPVKSEFQETELLLYKYCMWYIKNDLLLTWNSNLIEYPVIHLFIYLAQPGSPTEGGLWGGALFTGRHLIFILLVPNGHLFILSIFACPYLPSI